MSGKEENLQHAEAGSDPIVKFTHNELLDELKREFKDIYGHREPDDVDSTMLAQELGVSQERASQILNRKFQKGELDKILILENGKTRYVYRKRRTS